MTKTEKLRDVHTKWLKACRCELRKTATQGVPGHGSASAKVVFIGEAPGKTEDKVGRPFLGSAGKMLDKMLESIRLSREDIYITNIVKYRPPDNRDPNPEEVLACQEWLKDELEVIKPKVVVFLGRHALKYFFPEAKIGEVHGKILKDAKKRGVLYLPMYHPAAALYNGGLRGVLRADFQKLSKVLEKI